MKKIKLAILILFALWLLIFQVKPIKFFIYDLITAAMVRDQTPKIALDQIPEAAIFLDARSKQEYQISHLPNAVWVDPKSEHIDQLTLTKQQPIVLYCSIGYRSGVLGEKLIAQGYQNVYNLDGGLFKWHNKGKALMRAGKVTKDVHPMSNFWGIWLNGANRIKEVPRIVRKSTGVER